jgi:hypothetical protein
MERRRRGAWRFSKLASAIFVRYFSTMTAEELHARMKAYAMGWKETGELLEAERRARVRETDTVRQLSVFDGLALASLARFPPPPTSGLIEQQRVFAKLRRRQGYGR